MKKQDNYKAALQVLQSIRKQVDGLSNAPNTAQNILKEVVNRVKNSDHIAIIVALYNKKYLQNLFKAIQTQYQQKKSDQIEKGIAVLYVYGYDCFFKYLPQFNTFFEFFRQKISKIVDNKNYKSYSPQNERYQAMSKLLSEFGMCNDRNKQPYQLGKDLNDFIVKILNNSQPNTCFQQCIYTYIRIQIQEIQGNIVKGLKQQIGFCCKLHFQQGGSKNNVQTMNQNFNKELPALPSKKILKDSVDTKQLIKRHVISYLNSSSGIFYLGIQHTLQKQSNFHGIPLNQKDKLQILSWVLSEIVMKIYPPDEQNEDEDEKQQQMRMQAWRKNKQKYLNSKQGFKHQYQISRYISVDFINLYSSNTWLFSRLKEDIKYIIRIKVKLGDQYQVYHLINDKDIPQAYIRNDKNQKKLTVIQYYDEVYRRLKNKANSKSEEPPKGHSLCRFLFRDKIKK